MHVQFRNRPPFGAAPQHNHQPLRGGMNVFVNTKLAVLVAVIACLAGAVGVTAKSAQAASQSSKTAQGDLNNLVCSGGVYTKAKLLYYARGGKDPCGRKVAAIWASMGITLGVAKTMHSGTVCSDQGWISSGHLHGPVPSEDTRHYATDGQSFYARPLSVWGATCYQAWIGYTEDGHEVAVLMNCGNGQCQKFPPKHPTTPVCTCHPKHHKPAPKPKQRVVWVYKWAWNGHAWVKGEYFVARQFGGPKGKTVIQNWLMWSGRWNKFVIARNHPLPKYLCEIVRSTNPYKPDGGHACVPVVWVPKDKKYEATFVNRIPAAPKPPVVPTPTPPAPTPPAPTCTPPTEMGPNGRCIKPATPKDKQQNGSAPDQPVQSNPGQNTGPTPGAPSTPPPAPGTPSQPVSGSGSNGGSTSGTTTAPPSPNPPTQTGTDSGSGSGSGTPTGSSSSGSGGTTSTPPPDPTQPPTDSGQGDSGSGGSGTNTGDPGGFGG